MAKFYEIQIGDVYLTDTGDAAGDPCKLAVTGADALLSPYSGSTQTAVDGTPINQIFGGSKGKTLEIRALVLTAAVWTALVALVNTALQNSATINLIGAGDIGDFEINVLPLLPKPFEATEFKNGRIKNAVFRFVAI